MPSHTFQAEILDQPAALQRVIDTYTGPAGRERWARLPERGGRPVLVGMGASYHSALLGAHFLERRGITAVAREAADLLYEDGPVLAQATALLYISQSGASGEVAPLLERLPAGTPVIALTNDEHSLLARRADTMLPLLAGDEQTVATKTYLNTLALLWLLAARWSGDDQVADNGLVAAHEHITALLAQGAKLARRWAERLRPAKTLAFLGTGPQAVTARQCAMMAMEWLKVPALSASVGAFRHGPLEIVEPGLGAVLFAAPGPAYASTLRLAEELDGYGATVVVVENGQTRGLDDPAEREGVNDELAPLVDVVPVQLFIEALARERGLVGAFRRISKVVKHV